MSRATEFDELTIRAVSLLQSIADRIAGEAIDMLPADAQQHIATEVFRVVDDLVDAGCDRAFAMSTGTRLSRRVEGEIKRRQH